MVLLLASAKHRRCRRTGNLHIAESSLQHKAAFFTLLFLLLYPAGV